MLGADGLAGNSLRAVPGMQGIVSESSRIGLGAIVPRAVWPVEPGVIHMSCARRGYVGRVDLGDGTVAFGAAVDAELVRESGGPGSAVASLWREAGVAAPPLPHGLAVGELARYHHISTAGAAVDLRLPSVRRMSAVVRKATARYGAGAVRKGVDPYDY